MIKRVFIRVVGFTKAERHTLNTVFRLSQDSSSARKWSYEPWISGSSPTSPRLALIDGASPDASEALAELDATGGVGLIWVGSISPAKAWGAFERPIIWPKLLSIMDDYFVSSGDELEVDFGDDTWPSMLESTGVSFLPEQKAQRVLLADADNDSRLYLRTKLASVGITSTDEAANVLEAKDFLVSERLRSSNYDAVIVDLDLPGGDPWTVLESSGSPILKIVTQHRLSFSTRMSAKIKGCIAMGKPLEPTRLNELLAKIL
jgi:hypothetical protein